MNRRLIGVAAALLLGPSMAQAAAPVTKTVTGKVNEPVASVTVNGIAATVDNTALTFTAAAVPLAWGSNTITVMATDLAGNTGTAQITVQLGANINVQGTIVDASSTTATVNGAPVSVSNGAFSTTVQMTVGVNTVTVDATDAANNKNSKTSRVFLARPPVSHP